MPVGNWAVSTVAAAPSPATSGTSLTVASGHGSRFPVPSWGTEPPFPITLYPPGVSPDPTNAEVAIVTARSGDVLTISRAQEGTTARSVATGWNVLAGITANSWRLGNFTGTPDPLQSLNDLRSSTAPVFGDAGSSVLNTVYYTPFITDKAAAWSGERFLSQLSVRPAAAGVSGVTIRAALYKPVGYGLDKIGSDLLILNAGTTASYHILNVPSGSRPQLDRTKIVHYVALVVQGAGAVKLGFMGGLQQLAPSASLIFPVFAAYYDTGITGTLPATTYATFSVTTTEKAPWMPFNFEDAA